MAEGPSAEDRTEEPTQKKLDDAVAKGDVARSAELSVFLSLGALALALLLMQTLGTGRNFALGLKAYLANPHLVPSGGAGMMATARHAALLTLGALAVPVGLAAAAALAGGLLQHRPLWTFEPLTPKFSRLSPMAGLKRILGQEAMVQFAKGLLKIALVGAIATSLLWGERDRLEAMVGLGPAEIVSVALTLSLKLLGAVLALHMLITIADAVYSRFSWMRRQRMTKEELKREMKEQDGNPEIKAKVRQIRAERARKRMSAAVPTATVVVTNPTHYAVALRYEPGMAAPICVAKGVDGLALRIREIAGEHRVPVIENPPLARALHATVEVDDEIPVEHYRAVAEVIGFVLRLKRRAS